MSGLEGYKGPEIKENTDKQNGMSEFSDTQKSDQDKQTENTKDDLNGLKKQVDSKNEQNNIKISETIDTFEEQSNTKLTEQQKQDVSKLLSDSSKKIPSQNLFFEKVISTIKDYGNEVKYEDINEIVSLVLNDQETKSEKQETKSEKQETKSEKQETKSEKQEEKAETQEEKAETQETLKKENNLKNLDSSLNNLSDSNPHYGKIKGKIKELLGSDEKLNDSKQFNEEYESIINLLKTDENAFVHIADDLQKQDQENGTNKYGEFKNTLLSIDRGVFTEKIDRYEGGLTAAKQKIALGVDNINGVNISDNKLEKKMDDGYKIEVGGEGRKLSVEGSDYKLGSKLDNKGELKEVIGIEKSIKQELSTLNEKLNSISSVIDYIDNAISNDIDIDDVKEEIKGQNNELYYELNIENLGSLEEIKDSLSALYKQKEDEKEQKIKEKKKVVDEIVRSNALKAKEKDAQVHDTLKFLKSIGFDLIPQEITDNIIEQLNSNSGLRNMLGFTMNIDLKNGNLGIDSDFDINRTNINEKAKFAEFFNVMISGEKKGPLNIDNIRNGRGSPISSMSDFSIYLNDHNLKNSGTASNTMFKNIEKFIGNGGKQKTS